VAIASRLAHLMGGDISVQSVVGSGSRFTLTLQRAPETAAHDAPADPAHEGADGRVLVPRGPTPLMPPRSASILLVEDNEDNLFTLRQSLGGVAVELATATSGREAIDYCRRRRPDLIIMDMQMPGMSGLQATGAIRALPGGDDIPILALTAQAMKGDRERILAAGCDEYMAKPIQPRELRAMVERLLGEAAGRDAGAAGRPPQMDRSAGDEKGHHGTHTPRR
jgi:two-component system sensor histidine kinase/response regulator